MTEEISLYCLIKFRSCCILQTNRTHKNILMIGSEVTVIERLSEKIKFTDENTKEDLEQIKHLNFITASIGDGFFNEKFKPKTEHK